MFNKSERAYGFCLKTLKGFSDPLCSLRLFLQEQKGQTLIEAIVTIAIAFVIIGSIVALVNASNRRATLARQATQASKLAQEGMEIVRNIRDVGNNQAVQVGCLPGPTCSWSDLYENPVNTFSGRLQKPNTGDCAGITDSWCLVSGMETVLTMFTRTVEVSDDLIEVGVHDYICANPDTVDPLESENIKRVTVTVSWNSPIGAQSRTAVSCLSNWR